MLKLMVRKNIYYQQMLTQISPANLLPGIANLLDELDAASIPYAIASASRNAPVVAQRLGIAGRLGVLADGRSVDEPKPAPDLFRFAAAKLNVPPPHCLVIEDAAAGVQAGLAAGMNTLALGPAERFANLPHLRNRRDSLDGVTLAELQAMTAVDPQWVVSQSTSIRRRSTTWKPCSLWATAISAPVAHLRKVIPTTRPSPLPTASSTTCR